MKVRLAISIEGPTEREFVTRVLRPWLERYSVIVHPIDINGPSFSKARKDLRRLVEDRGYSHVTTLYDLYGFNGRVPNETPDQLESRIHDLVGGNTKLIPYVQAYEFEALIFAGPDEAGEILADANLPGRIRRIVAECGGPEQINDGYHTCPSRRLKAQHSAYDKVQHGYRIVERIGLTKVRTACPRFHAWVARLEALGRGP